MHTKIIFAFLLLASNIIFSQPSNYQKAYIKSIEKNIGKGYPVFFLDSAGYTNFVTTERVENLRSTIYGYFINDTVFFRPKSLAKDLPSCTGVLDSEINDIDKVFQDRENATGNRLLVTGSLKSIYTKAKYSPDQSTEKKIVLLYSTGMKKRFREFYQKVKSICIEKNIQLIVLSLDPIYFEDR